MAVKPHAFAAAHSFHSCTVTGYLPIANGLIVTWWTGRSVGSSLLPIAKLPPRMATISGSRTGTVDGLGSGAGEGGDEAGEGDGCGVCAAPSRGEGSGRG